MTYKQFRAKTCCLNGDTHAGPNLRSTLIFTSAQGTMAGYGTGIFPCLHRIADYLTRIHKS